MTTISKKARKRAAELGERAARAYIAKAAAPDTALSGYVYAQDRGDAYDPDPGVRELSWAETHGVFLAKARKASGGVGAGQLAFWEETARFDPDPGVREAMWTAIAEATGGVR